MKTQFSPFYKGIERLRNMNIDSWNEIEHK